MTKIDLKKFLFSSQKATNHSVTKTGERDPNSMPPSSNHSVTLTEEIKSISPSSNHSVSLTGGKKVAFLKFKIIQLPSSSHSFTKTGKEKFVFLQI